MVARRRRRRRARGARRDARHLGRALRTRTSSKIDMLVWAKPLLARSPRLRHRPRRVRERLSRLPPHPGQRRLHPRRELPRAVGLGVGHPGRRSRRSSPSAGPSRPKRLGVGRSARRRGRVGGRRGRCCSRTCSIWRSRSRRSCIAGGDGARLALGRPSAPPPTATRGHRRASDHLPRSPSPIGGAPGARLALLGALDGSGRARRRHRSRRGSSDAYDAAARAPEDAVAASRGAAPRGHAAAPGRALLPADGRDARRTARRDQSPMPWLQHTLERGQVNGRAHLLLAEVLAAQGRRRHSRRKTAATAARPANWETCTAGEGFMTTPGRGPRERHCSES